MLNQQQIAELCRLSLTIDTNTRHDVFFNYSGHVELVEVRVFFQGWDAEKDPAYQTSFCLDNEETAADQYHKTMHFLNRLAEVESL